MPRHALTNSQIAELLAIEAESAKMPAQKALRRASRRAFMWPEEAASLLEQGRSLTEFIGVGPYIETLIKRWQDKPPAIPERPALRRQFLTIVEAQALLAKEPSWLKSVKGDLQMHTTWSDGEGSIADMADAAIARGYDYIALTDHTKGLKIAGGINEEQLRKQADEIAMVNDRCRNACEEPILGRASKLTVLRSMF